MDNYIIRFQYTHYARFSGDLSQLQEKQANVSKC